MPRSLSASSLPTMLRQQLEMSAALARERVMEVHFRYAMELIEAARREVSPRRALAIYARLHKLRTEDEQTLCHDVLVALGRRMLQHEAQAKEEDGVEWEAPQSIVQEIRKRIRGRTNPELRKWVEYHTGRAETALLWAHVENALKVSELLRPERSTADAVALYAEALDIPGALTEIIYFLALDREISGAASTGSADSAPAEPTSKTQRRPLRIVQNRRDPAKRDIG